MSVQTTQETATEETDSTEEETPEVEETTDEEPSTEDAGDDEPEFDSARALAKIRKVNSENKNLRAENKRLKEATPAPKEQEDSGSDDDGPTREELLAKVARLEVLGEQGVPAKFAKFITATEPDAILEQVQELLELATPTVKAPNPRPKRKLGGGVTPSVETEETDPRKLAEQVPRY